MPAGRFEFFRADVAKSCSAIFMSSSHSFDIAKGKLRMSASASSARVRTVAKSHVA